MEWQGLNKGTKFYFIGIGGISMSALATFLFKQGYTVAGSDLSANEQVSKLRDMGVDIAVGESVDEGRISQFDTVVYTDAIPFENKELTAAFALSKKVLSRMSLLRAVAGGFSLVLGVGGSHGKTTCTAMCAHVLKEAGAAFCMHVGGEDREMGNFYFTGNDYFLTEACEYKKNLLMCSFDVAVLLNVDKDHLECYRDEADLQNTFLQFCANAKTAIVNMDDGVACRAQNVPSQNAVTFSLYERGADYRAAYLRQDREKYSFTVFEYGVKTCRIHLKTVGRCNVYNALAAFALMRTLGFSVQEIKRGLESFVAVKRRFEEVGKYRGADVICDYAHHPREILSTVQTAARITKNKLYVVFQPHTYSRTKMLMGEFIDVLKQVEGLLIYRTFPARERYDAAGDGLTLANAVGSCLYAENLSALRAWLDRTVSDGDTVLFLGAGDVYYLAKILTQKP